MKRSIAGIALAVLCAVSYAQQVAVIIPQFDLTGGATTLERDTITRYFMSDLANMRVFRVADRGNLEKRMAEMKFQTSDWSNSEKTAELMKGINADYVIIGTIVKRSDGLAVDAMLEELSTFEVIGTARVRMTTVDDAFDVMEDFVATLVKNVAGATGTGGGRATATTPAAGAAPPSGFVRIQGGTFTMGSPPSETDRDDNEAQHKVTVSGFYMGQYEVTQAEYEAVIGANPSRFKGGSLPVENVSWFGAVFYCNQRSVREGLTPAYTINGENVTWNKSANGYRLPTEAEWEYACRAGTTTPFNTGYNITTSQANYDGNYPYANNAKGTYRERTTNVGSFASNAWGLFDMHGNVYEWCWDWYGGYSMADQTDPLGAASGSYRVIRGGGWGGRARGLRSAYRSVNTPSSRIDNFGFRVVRAF